MKRYVYVRAICFGKDYAISFHHAIVKAKNEDDAYAKGHAVVDKDKELHGIAAKHFIHADNDYVVET